MLTDNKKIYIKVRKATSAYAKQNSKRLEEIQISRTIGSSVSSVNKMLANSEEQSTLMSDIIAISANDSTWTKQLKGYWDGFSYDIPENGKELEIGFVYDITALDRQTYISQINKNITVEKNKITTDEDLKDYINNRLTSVTEDFNKSIKTLTNITNVVSRQKALDEAYRVKYDSVQKIESERFKVGRPINSFHYILYRYCLVYGDVANEEVLVSKTPKIRFYLHSQEDIKKQQRAKAKTSQSRIKLLVNVIDSIESMQNLLYAMGEGSKIPTDDEDLYKEIEKISTDREVDFIRIASDSNLKLIGEIEKYIDKGILTRADGSNVIFNPLHTDSPIGNNMEEAIVYFKNQANKATVSEFKTRFSNLAI